MCLQAYFHPNNVVVIGLTVLHRALCNEARTGALGLQNGTGGAGNKESATTPHKRIEVRYSQVCASQATSFLWNC